MYSYKIISTTGLIKRTLFLFQMLFTVALICGCVFKAPQEYKRIAGYTQGTTFHITYETSVENDYSRQIDSILKAFDMTFSDYVPNSMISRINNNDPTVEINEMFEVVFTRSKEVYDATGGAFDLTVAPLVNAWGFGPNEKETVKSHKIDSLMHLVGMDKVRISGKKFIKDDPGIKIDMDGIAQGYSVDIICEFLENKGIKNYMVEIGGEVRAKGKNDKGKLWRIGVDRPSYGSQPGEELQAIISLENKAMTTAGNYRNYIEEDGVKYSHIIDPKTGRPVKNRLLSVTIVAEDALTADAWDTPCMVLGLEGTRELLKKHPELDAYLIYNDEEGNFRTEHTRGIKIEGE